MCLHFQTFRGAIASAGSEGKLALEDLPHKRGRTPVMLAVKNFGLGSFGNLLTHMERAISSTKEATPLGMTLQTLKDLHVCGFFSIIITS
jgi:hypothetical protein